MFKVNNKDSRAMLVNVVHVSLLFTKFASNIKRIKFFSLNSRDCQIHSVVSDSKPKCNCIYVCVYVYFYVCMRKGAKGWGIMQQLIIIISGLIDGKYVMFCAIW